MTNSIMFALWPDKVSINDEEGMFGNEGRKTNVRDTPEAILHRNQFVLL